MARVLHPSGPPWATYGVGLWSSRDGCRSALRREWVRVPGLPIQARGLLHHSTCSFLPVLKIDMAKKPKIEPETLFKADDATVKAEKVPGTLSNASSFCVTPFVSQRCPRGHPDFMATRAIARDVPHGSRYGASRTPLHVTPYPVSTGGFATTDGGRCARKMRVRIFERRGEAQGEPQIILLKAMSNPAQKWPRREFRGHLVTRLRGTSRGAAGILETGEALSVPAAMPTRTA